MTSETIFPLLEKPKSLADKIASKIHAWPILRCPICGATTIAHFTGDNLREEIQCGNCSAANRMRAMGWIIKKTLQRKYNLDGTNLDEIRKNNKLPAIYNSETTSPIHTILKEQKDYQSSEYFGPEYKSGDKIKGKAHQDLMDLSYKDKQFDIVLSADVFEHIPKPYAAHREVYRVLKSGGRHIFTVPFLQTEFMDQRRANIWPDGSIEHIMEPQYHGDPLRPDGILVFTLPGFEMLIRLREIGFQTVVHRLYSPLAGFLGQNNIVFEAIKT